MRAHHRPLRHFDDRGSTTVEAAIALVSLVMVLALALGATVTMADYVRCMDAAREAARLAARGEQDKAEEAVRRIAPKNAEVTITMTGEHVEVQVTAVPAGGLLPGLHLEAEAFAVREPDG